MGKRPLRTFPHHRRVCRRAVLIIAIDGPAASGKGTAARGLASALDYRYVDTGAIYRAVAWRARQQAIGWGDSDALVSLIADMSIRTVWDDGALRMFVDDTEVTHEIRSETLGAGASTIGAHPQARAALLSLQRRLAGEGRVVLDGRDVGSVVLPHADLKIFLTASLDERARRRQQELLQRGLPVDLADIRQRLQRRDAADSERTTAPLRAADDAIVVDSTGMTESEVLRELLRLAGAAGMCVIDTEQPPG